MTLALPALLLLLACWPGWIARSCIRRVGGHAPDGATRPQAWTEALLWAAGLHAGLIGSSALLGWPLLPAGELLQLLSPEPARQAGAWTALAAHGAGLGGYAAAVLVLAAAGPWALRRLVSRFRLDRRSSPLGALLRPARAHWYYLLSGADFAADALPDLIAVTTVVDVAGQPWLYKGVLDEYFVDRQGRLERLVLQQVLRRPLGSGTASAGSSSAGRLADRFEPIDGDCVVLHHGEITTLQVDYIRLGRTTEQPPRLQPVDDLDDAFAPTQPV